MKTVYMNLNLQSYWDCVIFCQSDIPLDSLVMFVISYSWRKLCGCDTFINFCQVIEEEKAPMKVLFHITGWDKGQVMSHSSQLFHNFNQQIEFQNIAFLIFSHNFWKCIIPFKVTFWGWYVIWYYISTCPNL